MTYVIRYSEHIDRKRLAKLPKEHLARIKKAIDQKLTTHPEVFGKPLRQSLEGCRSLRAGEYRVIYTISGKTVSIMLLGHRSTVYQEGDQIL